MTTPLSGTICRPRLGLAMISMYIKFEVSSLRRSRDILRDYKFKVGHVTWPRPFQGPFVICRLELDMVKPHTKFKVFAITCNEEMKGNAKCKISYFEPPFGDLGNARGSSIAR